MAARRRDPDFRAWVGVGGWGKVSVCYISVSMAQVALADELERCLEREGTSAA
jgi:hypothetical protein